jgi:hypothetical protein
MPRVAPLAASLPLALAACGPGTLFEVSGQYGVEFTENPDCVEIDVSTISLEAPFTVDAYILGGSGMPRYGKYPVVAWPGGFALYENENGSTVWGPTGDTGESAATFTPMGILDGAWHHLAGVYDEAGEATLYVDGKNYGFATLELAQAPEDTLYVGCWPTRRNAWFSGVIGEVALSSTARYAEDFTPEWVEFAADEDTLGLWHLNEGQGTAVLDDMDYSTGTLSGGEWVEFVLDGTDPNDLGADTAE